MIDRRSLLIALGSFAGGLAAAYVVRDIDLVRQETLEQNVVKPPVPMDKVIAEFSSGEIRRIGDLIVARSEYEWLSQHHRGVTDPFELTALLRGSDG